MKNILIVVATLFCVTCTWPDSIIPPIKIQPSRPLNLHAPSSQAVLQVLDNEDNDSLPNLLKNADWSQSKDGKLQDWQLWESGYTIAPNAGRNNENVVTMKRGAGSADMGISQQVTLNQTQPQTIIISGSSKAENVSGSPDSDYSLYIDALYQDGTPQYGIVKPFATGTHDWQHLQYSFVPDKPIKSLMFHALFRGSHTGQVWFRNLSLKQFPVDKNATRFDGNTVTNFQMHSSGNDIHSVSTSDGMALKINSDGAARNVTLNEKTLKAIPALSGFLARDVANGTGYYSLEQNKFAPLQLNVQKTIKSTFNAITISGEVQDQSGYDRAVSLVYAIPLDAIGWQWGDDISHSRTIVEGHEYSNNVSIGVGANGKMSQYPLAALWHGAQGIAICLDMNQAAQFRVAYNATLECLYIVYDIGMTQELPRAPFQFDIYSFDGNWGYRAAVAKMYTLFPNLFEVRGAAKEQGLWMPFSKIQDVQGWQDFDFRFREAGYDKNIAWDDANNILTFRYSEPTTWWMPMQKTVAHDYPMALAQAQSYLGEKNANSERSEALLNSGMRRADGTLALRFIDAPWTDGAVWNLNTLPGLSGVSTGAKLVWNDARKAQYASKEPFGELDGEYLDSTEAYVTTDLDFDRDHFAATTTPLTFDTETHQPGVYKELMIYELARQMHHDLKAMGKYLFANSTPHRICFLTPWFDALGTETNWLHSNKSSPPDDQTMNLWRTMSGQKAYCLLQNTNMEAFGPYVEKYFQRSLFYGIFPGFFSADASTHPYWENPGWYNRDRPFFKKYIPLIQNLSAAGWQPVTLARSDNSQIRLERFGNAPGDKYVQENAPHLYLTAMNTSDKPQHTMIKMEDAINPQKNIAELISGKVLLPKDNALDVTLQPGQVILLQLH